MAIRRFTTTDGREGVQFSNGAVVTIDPRGYLYAAISLDELGAENPDVGVMWIDRSVAAQPTTTPNA